MSSFVDNLYRADAYYSRVNTGDPENTRKLPWKIEWDPSLGTDNYSEEIIRIDLNATTVSGQDPDTYERYFNPSFAEAVLPLRHSLFDGSPSHPIRIWTLTQGGSVWLEVPNATGIEGIDASAAFFIRRDIPLSGDVGFTVGRVLFKGLEGLPWTNISHIKVEVLYLGDYVQSKSFQQDLHEDANVVHRNLEVDYTGSFQRNYTETQTARHSKLYRELQSSFLYGEPKASPTGRSYTVTDASYVHTLQATSPNLRFGIHDVVYSSISTEDQGQAHIGNWPAGADYYFITREPTALNTANLNLILSHLQQPRPDLVSAINEHNNEVAIQYDANEKTWQAGAAWDVYRREYGGAETPYLTRRYPILARFVQGRTALSNADWVGAGPNLQDRVFPLQQASGKHALVTTFDSDPTLLQAHPDVTFNILDGRIQYLEGISELRLFAPTLDFNSGEFLKWVASESSVSLTQGHSGTRYVPLLSHEMTVSPSATSGANMTRARWRMRADAVDPHYSLQISPAATQTGGVYSQSTWRDFLRIGMRGHGTAASSRFAHIGHPDITTAHIDVQRNVDSSFDLVFASHVLPRVRGNIRIEGILDNYGDFALGRDRQENGAFNDTLGRNALVRGVASTDTVEINRTTSGFLNVKGDSLHLRRLTGPTLSRIDMQMRQLLGWEMETIPGMNVDYRDFKPFEYYHWIASSKDVVDATTELTSGVSNVTGKVDSYRSKYIQYEYSGGDIVETDYTSDIIDGYLNEEDKIAELKVTSGYARGQLHRDGLTARGEHGLNVPVIMDRAGVPGESVAHAGAPEHLLNSSDMYLDADGRWRYLFDKVYLPVEMS
ncbi:MAG: hypothetical protein LC687_05175 [Actinobacteria bacterium]|nr:hypothetical protein [Actinomycetota bacterium]MCA1807224.1 hypothetical protein [Actinomycetota bacterium]